MMNKNTMNMGVVGAVNRGSHFTKALHKTDFFKCHAVCDTDVQGLEDARVKSGAVESYMDYEQMLDRSDIQAVFIGTPMFLHASMAIAALERGLHVICEVTPTISIEECQALEKAVRASKGIYMLAENYTFMKPNAMIERLVGLGLFGQTYYAEGEYLHEVRELNVQTPWRRLWGTGINGITYGTHSLGPILRWFPGERVESVCCVGSGHHYKDHEGKYYENEDSCVMLCKTTKGGLIKIRLDMLSDRPHAMTNYSLQGTEGAYESARSEEDIHRIWLRSRHPKPEQWEHLWNLLPEHTPDIWRNEDILKGVGHGGGDLLELIYFRDVILQRTENKLDIHRAMDMTLPGLVSQQSILQNGQWLPVPNSRDW